MKKIGVIGATGMLGHHTAKVIQENPENHLIVIHRATSNLDTIQDLKFESRIANLNDKDSLVSGCKDLDYVLNCGAYYPTIPKSLKEEIAIAKKQMENYITAIKENNVKKALYLGGAIVIPKSEDGIANEEERYDAPPSNKSAYVQVKWLMDKMARQAGKSGIPIVIGIPSMTFGEYDYGPSTGQIIVHTLNQTIPGFVNGNRNVVYAGDAARGLVAACMKGIPGERYLITGENISMEALIAKIAKIGGIDQMPKQVPLGLAKLISKIKMTKYRFFGGALPLLNDTAIAVMSAGQFLNGDKAKDQLGYIPQVSVDETLEKTITWFKTVGYISSRT